MKKTEMTIDATVENLDRVMAFLEECLEEADCPMKTQMQISVAAEEVYVNIAHYAYAPETGQATLHVEISDEPCSAYITFIDNGIPFDPLKKADPDVSLSAEDREIGGLGIFMAKKTMDEIHYEHRDGQNRLTMVKRLRG